MDADLTCEYCKGGGWFSDDAGRYRCQECWGHGSRRPSLAEWDALRAERDRYREALKVIALTPSTGASLSARAALGRETP